MGMKKLDKPPMWPVTYITHYKNIGAPILFFIGDPLFIFTWIRPCAKGP